MCAPSVPISGVATLSSLPAEYLQARWYAVQTGANQERQVTSRLNDKGVESFLPVYEEARRRTDRKVILQVPLFAGYLFARIALRDRLRVLEVPRVVRLVSFGSTPVAVPDREIESLRTGVGDRRVLPHPYLKAGQPVRVIAGALAGMEGVLLRRKSSLRVVIAVNAIARCFSVEVDEGEVEAIRISGAGRR